MNKVYYNFYGLCISFIFRVLYLYEWVSVTFNKTVSQKQFPSSELADVYLMTLFYDKIKVIRRVLIRKNFCTQD